IVNRLMEIAAEEMKCPVEIEFACNLETTPAIFNVLQIRPISADSLQARVDWDAIDQTDPLLISESALGTGELKDVADIVYLRKESFDILRTREIADQIRRLNDEFRRRGRGYLLIGFGRWGSSIPTLGVPVQWSDISEARAIVEASLENFRVDPSQGSHFFQNLTSFNVGYINIDTFARKDECYHQEMLDRLPAEWESEFVRHVHLDKPMRLVVDGFKSRAFGGL
ncbi:MAG: phosphoenolpyruvate synthase, partial [Bacteroidales bacterium]|nr:phosphoenolpyruvate synthase [Candidatus Colicola faecequi]